MLQKKNSDGSERAFETYKKKKRISHPAKDEGT